MNISSVTLRTDSIAAIINWIESLKNTSRMKHINRKYYFVKDEVMKKNIKLEHVKFEQMDADF